MHRLLIAGTAGLLPTGAAYLYQASSPAGASSVDLVSRGLLEYGVVGGILVVLIFYVLWRGDKSLDAAAKREDRLVRIVEDVGPVLTKLVEAVKGVCAQAEKTNRTVTEMHESLAVEVGIRTAESKRRDGQ